MANYLPNTPEEIRDMLSIIGVKTVDDLFAEIPEHLRLSRPLKLPRGRSEPEVFKHLKMMSEKNTPVSSTACFMGAGAYDHFTPSVVDHLLLRGDFFTAYTPYQAEVSQGTLQVIYEFQSLICELTGMDQSNASMYEGGSALSEAVMMAMGHTGRRRIVLLQSVHPEYRAVVHTLTEALDVEIVVAPCEDGAVDPLRLSELVNDQTAAVVCQYPNFFGTIEDLEAIGHEAKSCGALFIVSAEPVALGLLTPPGEFGADIVTGEGQPLGIPLAFGGPYLGFMAATKALIRRMPGRIAGVTKDNRGQRGFVLTLQAREQHIRREKASSNICTNQALMALAATIHLSVLGAEGLKETALQCFRKAHFLKRRLAEVPEVVFPFSGSFFNEFVIKIPDARKNLGRLARKGILGGVPLDKWYSTMKDHVLVAVTEKRTAEEIDLYVSLLKGLLS